MLRDSPVTAFASDDTIKWTLCVPCIKTRLHALCILLSLCWKTFIYIPLYVPRSDDVRCFLSSRFSSYVCRWKVKGEFMIMRNSTERCAVLRLTSSVLFIPVCYRGVPVSIPDQPIWDSWWTKWHWDTFLPSTTVYPCHCHSISAPYSFTCHRYGSV